MATYVELKDLFNDSDLQDKVQVALLISLQELLDGTPTVDQQKYAVHAFSNRGVEAHRVLASVLAANASMTVAQIKGA